MRVLGPGIRIGWFWEAFERIRALHATRFLLLASRRGSDLAHGSRDERPTDMVITRDRVEPSRSNASRSSKNTSWRNQRSASTRLTRVDHALRTARALLLLIVVCRASGTRAS
jgi:hypothetical protein